MGAYRVMMEKVMFAASRNLGSPDINVCGTRYGNVMGSRGSVIPLFLELINEERPITITDRSMTCFMMNTENAVDLVFLAFSNARNGDILVQNFPAATINTVTTAILEFLGKPLYLVQVNGARHGEKLHETLLIRKRMTYMEDLDEYHRIAPDLRGSNCSKYFEKGEITITSAEDYTSYKTNKIESIAMKNLLLKLDFFKQFLFKA